MEKRSEAPPPQLSAVYHDLTFTLRCFVLLHMKKMIALKPPVSCWDPIPHLQHCRTECYQKQTDELKKERKPFIQLSERVACHLCATFPHGQRLAAADSHPAPANIRTWPLSGRAYAGRGFRGECVGSGINQMFELHLPPSLSLSLSLSLC